MLERPVRPDELRGEPKISDEKRRRITAARLVVGHALNPKVEFCIEAIARATKLREDTVREILGSPEWQETVNEQLQLRVNGLLGKGLVRVEQIMEDDDSSRKMYLDAMNVLIKLKAQLNTESQDNSKPSLEKALKMLEAVETQGKLKRPKITVTNS